MALTLTLSGSMWMVGRLSTVQGEADNTGSLETGGALAKNVL